MRYDFKDKPQIVYYQAGVGSGPSILNKLTGGLTGAGISDVGSHIGIILPRLTILTRISVKPIRS